VGSACVSQCSTCGVLCEAFPISDISSLRLYSTKGCTIVAGDLYLVRLPFSITLAVLFDHLQTIRHIRGTLYLQDCPWVTSLFPFRNLLSLKGASFSNMENLVDARIPGLQQLVNKNVHVENCNRLCPARYTAVGTSPDDSDCPNLQVRFFVRVEGVLPVSSILDVWQDVMFNALRNISANEVRVSCLVSHMISYHFNFSGLARSKHRSLNEEMDGSILLLGPQAF